MPKRKIQPLLCQFSWNSLQVLPSIRGRYCVPVSLKLDSECRTTDRNSCVLKSKGWFSLH